MLYKITDYTETPGGRFKKHGDYSAEEFRDEILYPLFQKVKNNDDILLIDLDGTYGLPACFLEETFGGLVRLIKNRELVLNKLDFISKEEPQLISTIRRFMMETPI